MSTMRATSNFSKKRAGRFYEERGLLHELAGLILIVARIDIRYSRSAVEGDVLHAFMPPENPLHAPYCADPARLHCQTANPPQKPT